ncbi:bifunctional nuclease family protein [bacterium]|jgi:uncharacterized protein|nr:bifunctional nuclease family protein [bacterium]MBT3580865.1 bifunctional nuclease family protein [bacterium]MBT4552431.1 bifunctional nuclease family protein [bacterium]
MVEMQLGGLGFDPKNMSPIVLLKDQEERNFLPIWIGMFEAAAIAMELQDFTPPRPMTHDVITKIITELKAKVTKIIISEIIDNTFYAIVEIQSEKDENIIKLDCRPSDAIAIGVRSKVPFYVSESVMLKAKMVNSEKDEEETKKFKNFVENIKPEDFSKYIDKR